MIQYEIPIALLDTNGYWGSRSMILKPEFKQWLDQYAPSAKVFMGFVWQIVTFYDEETAALARLTWGVKPLREHSKVADVRC